MKKDKFIVFLAVVVLLAKTGCNEIPDCDEPFTTELIIQFRDLTNSTPTPEIFESIRELETGFVFAENDTIAEVVLEIDPLKNSTSYVFEGNDLTDTLKVAYRLNQILVSEFCGPVLRVFDMQILHHTFSDTIVVNRELLRNEINFQIIR